MRTFAVSVPGPEEDEGRRRTRTLSTNYNASGARRASNQTYGRIPVPAPPPSSPSETVRRLSSSGSSATATTTGTFGVSTTTTTGGGPGHHHAGPRRSYYRATRISIPSSVSVDGGRESRGLSLLSLGDFPTFSDDPDSAASTAGLDQRRATSGSSWSVLIGNSLLSGLPSPVEGDDEEGEEGQRERRRRKRSNLCKSLPPVPADDNGGTFDGLAETEGRHTREPSAGRARKGSFVAAHNEGSDDDDLDQSDGDSQYQRNRRRETNQSRAESNLTVTYADSDLLPRSDATGSEPSSPLRDIDRYRLSIPLLVVTPTFDCDRDPLWPQDSAPASPALPSAHSPRSPASAKSPPAAQRSTSPSSPKQVSPTPPSPSLIPAPPSPGISVRTARTTLSATSSVRSAPPLSPLPSPPYTPSRAVLLPAPSSSPERRLSGDGSSATASRSPLEQEEKSARPISGQSAESPSPKQPATDHYSTARFTLFKEACANDLNALATLSLVLAQSSTRSSAGTGTGTGTGVLSPIAELSDRSEPPSATIPRVRSITAPASPQSLSPPPETPLPAPPAPSIRAARTRTSTAATSPSRSHARAQPHTPTHHGVRRKKANKTLLAFANDAHIERYGGPIPPPKTSKRKTGDRASLYSSCSSSLHSIKPWRPSEHGEGSISSSRAPASLLTRKRSRTGASSSCASSVISARSLPAYAPSPALNNKQLPSRKRSLRSESVRSDTRISTRSGKSNTQHSYRSRASQHSSKASGASSITLSPVVSSFKELRCSLGASFSQDLIFATLDGHCTPRKLATPLPDADDLAAAVLGVLEKQQEDADEGDPEQEDNMPRKGPPPPLQFHPKISAWAPGTRLHGYEEKHGRTKKAEGKVSSEGSAQDVSIESASLEQADASNQDEEKEIVDDRHPSESPTSRRATSRRRPSDASSASAKKSCPPDKALDGVIKHAPRAQQPTVIAASKSAQSSPRSARAVLVEEEAPRKHGGKGTTKRPSHLKIQVDGLMRRQEEQSE